MGAGGKKAGGRGWWGVILGIMVLLMAGAGALAGERAVRGSGSPGFSPEREFTLVAIEPDAAKGEVRLVFSHPLPLEVLQRHLTFLPRLKVDWSESRLSPEGVLTVKGNFRFGRRYAVHLPEDLEVAGRRYRQTISQFYLPDRPPFLEFLDDKTVVERQSPQLIHLRAENAGPLEVEALTVPPLLLPHALAAQEGRRPPAEVHRELSKAVQDLTPHLQGPLAAFRGEVAQARQLFGITLEKNRLQAVSLPLTFRGRGQEGALVYVQVRHAGEGQAVTPPRLYRLTDLGLTYKKGRGRLLVWASSLREGRPLAAVQVLALTRDFQLFPLGKTGPDGVLVFAGQEVAGLSLARPGAVSPVSRRVEPEEVAFLLAGLEGDCTYAEVRPRGEMQPKGVWQESGDAPVAQLRGHLFTERGVYRPGETVYFKGTVREWQGGRIGPPAGGRVGLTAVNPKGETVMETELALSEFGTAAGEFTLPAHSPLGTYTLSMRFGAALAPAPAGEEEPANQDNPRPPREEARTTFEVQEFTPPRHFVELDFSRLARELPEYAGRAAKREFVRISIRGQYYAGGPVKNGQVRWKISRAKTSFPQEQWAGFVFGYDEGRREELIEAGQALLDDQGQTEILFPLEQAVLTGRQGLLVVATVLDFDGRAASQSRTFQVEPEILLGLKPPAGPLRVGEELQLRVMALRRGQPLPEATLQAEVLAEGWGYVAKRNEQGDLYWDEQQVWRRVSSQSLRLVKGEALFTTGLAHGGEYLVTVSYRDPAGRVFAAALPVSVEWGFDAEERRKKPLAYQPLTLAADRAAYEPGQTARIFLSASRPVSHYLITLERQGIFRHQVVAASGPTQTLEIPIGPEFAPNVYLSVLGLTPRGEFPLYSRAYDSEAPGCLWGTLNLPVRLTVAGLKVSLAGGVPELKAEPGQRLTVDFRVTDAQGKGVEAEMAVAVVDEAVLALTAYKTPTLESLLRFDLPLQVSTGDLRALLLLQTPFRLARSEPLTGGGGLKEDLVAKLRKDFKAVAYFNPAVRTDAQGRAQVSFTLPDNLTTFRIYAVVLDRGSRFASAERPLVVSKDFYLEPGIPGFFTVGDTFRFLVNVVNHTPRPGEVSLSAVAEGGLVLTAEEPRAALPAKDSRKLAVRGQATEAGPARVRAAARLAELSDAVELPVQVRSGYLSGTAVQFGSVTGTAEVAVSLPPEITALPDPKKLTGEIKALLTLSGSPFLRLRPALQYLFTYPYGCAEQTASGVLGLAALRQPVRQGMLDRPSPEELDRFLDKGVSRLLTMQTASGGFAYWPGQRDAHPWGSLYATAALTVARRQGLAVPAAGLEQAQEYLKARLREARTPPEYKAFAAYLLAVGGVLDRGLYSQAAQEEPRLSREGRLLLILAAAQGKLKPVKELSAALRPLLVREEKAIWQDEFQARFRAQALAVLAGQLLLPGDPQVREAAHKLLAGLDRQGRWTSTSDTGWCLLALAEYFRDTTFAREPAEITASQPGGPPQRLRLDPKSFRTVSLNPELLLAAPRVSLAGPPGTTWLYELQLTYPRLEASLSGEAAGFTVKKSLANTDGSAEIRVGDLVKVRVELETDLPQLQYVVLDDPLPAGLVAINTAFKTEEPLPEGEEPETEDDFDYLEPEGRMRFRPHFFEIRQDRVLAFRDRLWRGPQVFEYYARAVCQGTFVVPGAQVSAMYAPAVRGSSPQTRLVIQGR